jgi:hypothetical protein
MQLRQQAAVNGVQRVHVQLGGRIRTAARNRRACCPRDHGLPGTRPGTASLDAPSELLTALHISMGHPVLARCSLAGRVNDGICWALRLLPDTSVTRSRITENVRSSVTMTGPGGNADSAHQLR